MVKELAEMMSRAPLWSEDRQREAAQLLALLDRAGDSAYSLSDPERADVLQALEDFDRGVRANQEDVSAIFKRAGV